MFYIETDPLYDGTPDEINDDVRADRAFAYADEHGCWRTADANVGAWRRGEPRVYRGPHADAISAILSS